MAANWLNYVGFYKVKFKIYNELYLQTKIKTQLVSNNIDGIKEFLKRLV